MEVFIGTDASEPQSAGTWIKGDTVSPLPIFFKTRGDDWAKAVYALVTGDTITLELRSLDRTLALSVTAAAFVTTTGRAEFKNLGASWTAPAGKTEERFEAFVKLVRSAAPAWGKPAIKLTLRTAP